MGLDPGITTGFATGQITHDGMMLVTSGQDRLSHMQFYELLRITEPNIIVCERFEFRQGNPQNYRKGLELFSRELIGVAMLYQEERAPEVEIKLQPPMKNSATTFFNDKRLTEMGIRKSGQEHANDAMRHLCYWFEFGPGFQFNKKGIRSAVLR